MEGEKDSETQETKKGKSYPGDFRAGQTISLRISDTDVKNLTALYKNKKFQDLQTCLRFCIKEAKARNCW